MAVTVLIVDDHPAFRESARELLGLEGFHVVGEAADGATGIALTHELEPEVVLLDVALPDLSGFDVAERLAGRATVVLVSSRERRDLGPRVRLCGALGFIPKDELSGEALSALLEEAA